MYSFIFSCSLIHQFLLFQIKKGFPMIKLNACNFQFIEQNYAYQISKIEVEKA